MPVHAEAFIHPTAEVEDPCEIGAGSRIWRHCHVMSGARLGARVVLGQGCFVGRGVTVGSGCRVQNGVSLFEGVELEDDVFVGPNATFTNVVRPRAFAPAAGPYERTLVERGATIGAAATIVAGVRVGRYALVGAGAVVAQEVPAFALVVGVPARRVGWVGVGGEPLCIDEAGRATCARGLEYRLVGARVEQVTGGA